MGDQVFKPVWFVLAALIAMATGLALITGMSTGSEAQLPVLGQVPEFELTSQQDRPVNSNELSGKIWVADLIFTACSGPCLRMTSQMSRVQEGLKEWDGFRMVSISVDPERDTPERLTWYAEQTLADPDIWMFLTGEMDIIRSLAVEGLKLVVEKEEGSAGILHSDRFVLVDDAGRIRGYYDGTDPDAVDEMIRAARGLLKTL